MNTGTYDFPLILSWGEPGFVDEVMRRNFQGVRSGKWIRRGELQMKNCNNIRGGY